MGMGFAPLRRSGERGRRREMAARSLHASPVKRLGSSVGPRTAHIGIPPIRPRCRPRTVDGANEAHHFGPRPDAAARPGIDCRAPVRREANASSPCRQAGARTTAGPERPLPQVHGCPSNPAPDPAAGRSRGGCNQRRQRGSGVLHPLPAGSSCPHRTGLLRLPAGQQLRG
jgi:hypothetical protein